MLPRGCDTPARWRARSGRARICSHTSATRGSSASRSPELSITMSAFASRSSRDACTATRARASASDMPRCATSRSTATSVGTSTTIDRGEPTTTGFDEQRDVEDDDVVGVLLGRDPPSRLGADRWVHDLVECLQRLGVVEDDRRRAPGRSRRPSPSRIAGAEPLDDRREDGLTRLLQLSGDRVGVDHHRPVAREQARDRRLPGSDAPGEADQDHRPCYRIAHPPRPTPPGHPRSCTTRPNRGESRPRRSRPFTLRRRPVAASAGRRSSIDTIER